MKKTLTRASAVILVAVCVLALFACNQVKAEGLWEDATYLNDTTLGNGKKTVTVSVEAGDQMVTFTLKTDKETLGEALYEHSLINDPSFFDTCNGMKADWDADKAYWAFMRGDETMMIGVGDAKISDGDSYRIVYTK